LQGIWYGQQGLEARFEKDRLTYYRNGRLVNVYTITLDESSQPRSYRIKGIGGGAADGRVYRGIYQIRDRTLIRTSVAGEKTPLPREFGDPNASKTTTQVFTR
jgi:uncharacterized protein (TIGR03067 family)